MDESIIKNRSKTWDGIIKSPTINDYKYTIKHWYILITTITYYKLMEIETSYTFINTIKTQLKPY